VSRRAVVWLGAGLLTRLLRLPEGQRVTGVHADWLRLGVGISVEGGDLPEVDEMREPPSIEPAGYVDLDLRANLEALLHRYSDERDGPRASDFAGKVRETLAGTFDPQVDMPEELRP
jgi:hypothetical protein